MLSIFNVSSSRLLRDRNKKKPVFGQRWSGRCTEGPKAGTACPSIFTDFPSHAINSTRLPDTATPLSSGAAAKRGKSGASRASSLLFQRSTSDRRRNGKTWYASYARSSGHRKRVGRGVCLRVSSRDYFTGNDRDTPFPRSAEGLANQSNPSWT